IGVARRLGEVVVGLGLDFDNFRPERGEGFHLQRVARYSVTDPSRGDDLELGHASPPFSLLASAGGTQSQARLACGCGSHCGPALPALVSSVAGVAGVIAVGRLLWGWQAGALAGLIVVTTPLYFNMSHQILPDGMLNAWLVWALYWLLRGQHAGWSLGPVLAFYACFTGALLSKGPQALAALAAAGVAVAFTGLALLTAEFLTARVTGPARRVQTFASLAAGVFALAVAAAAGVGRASLLHLVHGEDRAYIPEAGWERVAIAALALVACVAL